MASWFGHPTEEELLRTAAHEAAHAVIAFRLGFAVRWLTIEPGTGCAGAVQFRHPSRPAGKPEMAQPFALWPPGWRDYVERELLVTLAGHEAELRFLPRLGRTPEPVAVAAISALEELPPVSDDQRAEAVAHVNAPAAELITDEEHVQKLARVAHGNEHRLGATWIAYMQETAAVLVVQEQAAIVRLGEALTERGVVSGEQAAAIIRDAAAA